MQRTPHQRCTAFHRVLNSYFFPIAMWYLVAIVVHLTNYSEPRLLVPSSPEQGYGYFQTGLFSLLRPLRLELGMPPFPANSESINSSSFWQHIIPGTNSNTGRGHTTTGVSGKTTCAQSTQLYGSLGSDLE